MKKTQAVLFFALALVAVVLVAPSVHAQTFTVPTGAFDDVTADIVAWGTAFIAVALSMVGYKWVRRILH